MLTATVTLSCLALSAVIVTAGPAAAATVRGTNGADRLQGTAANDEMVGGGGNDTLLGGGGADKLHGNAGADKLIGGPGKDVLSGNDGNDTYVFSGQFDSDIISDGATSSGDVAQFTDLRSNQVTLRREGGKVVVSTPNGTVTINNAAGNGGADRLVFSDGNSIQLAGSVQGGGSGSGGSGQGGGSGSGGSPAPDPAHTGYAVFGNVRVPFDTRDPDGFRKAADQVESIVNNGGTNSNSNSGSNSITGADSPPGPVGPGGQIGHI